MSAGPTPFIAGLPAVRPFLAPEAIARRTGIEPELRLGANESAFGPSPRALEAMRASLERVAFYGDPESHELRVAIGAMHARPLAETVIASGIDELLGLVVRAYLAPGDATVATRGSYPTYVYHVTGYGARLATVDYRPDGRVPLAELAALAHATGARVAYLANPDNPSGTFASAAEVAAFRAALPAATLLLLDEAYADFVDPSELAPDAALPNTVRTRTFSKAHGLAGARIAYALGPAEAIAAFEKVRLHFGVARPAQAAALASLADPGHVARVVAEVARGRDDYARAAGALGLATLPSRTNFVCVDVGSPARSDAAVGLMLERGVFIRKPTAAPLDGHLRITVGDAAQRPRVAAALASTLAALDAAGIA